MLHSLGGPSVSADLCGWYLGGTPLEDFLVNDPVISQTADLKLKPAHNPMPHQIAYLQDAFHDLGQERWRFLFEHFNWLNFESPYRLHSYFELELVSRNPGGWVVKSPRDGEVLELPEEILFHRLYMAEPFVPPPLGDYVQVGADDVKGIRRKYIVEGSRYPQKLLFVGKGEQMEFPFPGRYLGPSIAEGLHVPASRIEILGRGGGRPIVITVPNQDLFRSRLGNVEKLKQALAPIYQQRVSFVIGENVGWRGPFGKVEKVRILALHEPSDSAWITWRSLIPIHVSQRRLYRPWEQGRLSREWGSQNIFTANSIYFWNNSHLTRPYSSPVFRAFSDAALYFASSEDFRNRSTKDKLEILGLLIRKHLPWREGGLHADDQLDWGQLLCFGVGVCRNHNYILGLVLRELGLPVRFPLSEGNIARDGHIWVEVLIDRYVWVIDLSVREGIPIKLDRRRAFGFQDRSMTSGRVNKYIYLQGSAREFGDY